MADLDERVDDCIATALGGNENYDRTLAEHQDVAVFMTPMWAANWRITDGSSKSAGLDKSRDMGAMLKGLKFSKVARIGTGLCFEPGFEDNVDDFAGTFDLERIELSGGTAVVDRCYRQAKPRIDCCKPLPRAPKANMLNVGLFGRYFISSIFLFSARNALN